MGSVLLGSGACYHRSSGLFNMNTSWTIAAWIKRVGNYAASEGFLWHLVDSGEFSGDSTSFFFNYPALYSSDNVGSTLSLTSSITTTTTNWQYWGFRRNGSTLSVSVDGSVVRTGTAAVGARGAMDFFCLGHLFFASVPANMKVARHRIWQRALTDPQLATEGASSTVVDGSNLVANHVFNSGSLTTDSSGNGFTLVVSAGTPVFDADEPSFGGGGPAGKSVGYFNMRRR